MCEGRAPGLLAAALALGLLAFAPARASDLPAQLVGDGVQARGPDGAVSSLLPPSDLGRGADPEAASRARGPRGPDSMLDAFRSGVRGYNAGDKVAAARALEAAAEGGHVFARWKLARMYAAGDGLPRDDLKAFEHFSRLADEHADDGPDVPTSRVVASAFVALGSYFLDGIPGTYVKPDPARARDLFRYAAAYFGDRDGQYSFARTLLEGTGGPRDDRQAARWLYLAAEKGHRPSQALLGHLLFKGGQGVTRKPALGLMWLETAGEAADATSEGWIADMRERALASATPAERQAAANLAERRRK